MGDRAPDLVEPHIGWRVWSVVEEHGDLRLSSLVYHVVWPPGRPMVASCRRPLAALPWARLPLHGPPNYDCCCGIYALETAAAAGPYLTAAVANGPKSILRVLGTVSLWGRVVEGAFGWRAAYAYPERLLVPVSTRRRLALACAPGLPSLGAIVRGLQRYDVPIEIVRTSELPRPRENPRLPAAA